MSRTAKLLIATVIILCVITLACDRENFWKYLHGKKDHGDDKLSNELVLEWSTVAYNAAGGPAEGHPLLATRIEAMMHIAIHDALNAIVPMYEQYSFKSHEYASADPFAAVASAAHAVLKASWPDSAAMFDAKLSASVANIPDGPAKIKGIALGIASANAILALRANDSAYRNPVVDIPASEVPGVYIAVPPNNFEYAPFWATMQLFSLNTHDQFRSLPPPPLTSADYARDLNEVKAFGEKNSTVRTAEQSAFTNFWYEFSDMGWNRIARIQARDRHLGLYATARMFALLDIALADTYTAFFESKQHYYTWRPYTAIRAADKDDNDQTTPDPNWEPYMITPPIPEYPSGHSALGKAAATVLSDIFGAHQPFTTTSSSSMPAGIEKSFKSFGEAADENADSRVMADIHFRFACESGKKLGAEVGKWVVDHELKPLH